jgi:hypothetical protein
VTAPESRKPGPPQTRQPANTINTRESNDAPAVWAVAYPPAGHRRRWLVVVLRCTQCQGSHHHYLGDNTGGLRRRGCGAGSYYVRPRAALAVAG